MLIILWIHRCFKLIFLLGPINKLDSYNYGQQVVGYSTKCGLRQSKADVNLTFNIFKPLSNQAIAI